MITMIAAVNKYGTLGLDGRMPWHAPEDLKHFKKYTMGKDLLMGRITFDGLPQKLRGRNIHIYSQDSLIPNSVQDIDAFLDQYDKIKEECVVCGGGMVYKRVLPRCDRLILSFIKDNDVIGDVFFPDFSLNDFRIIDTKCYAQFNLVTYERVIR